ncbi:PiggyBac transposable element-derived protein 4-like [Oopsacas minuta]|uniref:PiggyBac transposable element-derived protein 4-like n=1 Tax=Oopsacas minuta TaxID=111878 RepID=A0AAV7KI28_9METZ|nr:PiggyBac transposable element-derived protein 4-like [Oopsacas minuta]
MNSEKRHIFVTKYPIQSPSGLERIDLQVYAIEANKETRIHIGKTNRRRRMDELETPIERYYPQLLTLEIHTRDQETRGKVQKVPLTIKEPTHQLHPTPPTQQHSLSEEVIYLLDCNEPIQYFEAIFRPYEFRSILQQTKLYRTQMKFHLSPYKWKEPTYEEIRCSIGLILWTSHVQMPNRRSSFTDSNIFHLSYFKRHSLRNRFEELFPMLHFASNEQMSPSLNTAVPFGRNLAHYLPQSIKTRQIYFNQLDHSLLTRS